MTNSKSNLVASCRCHLVWLICVLSCATVSTTAKPDRSHSERVAANPNVAVAREPADDSQSSAQIKSADATVQSTEQPTEQSAQREENTDQSVDDKNVDVLSKLHKCECKQYRCVCSGVPELMRCHSECHCPKCPSNIP